MFTFRPHTILRFTQAEPGYEAPNGDWIPGTDPVPSDPIPCRFVGNGKAVAIALPNGDGSLVQYSYEVYLDLGNAPFRYGETVRLFDCKAEEWIPQTPLVAEMMVRGHSRGQLNTRIWL